MSQKDTQPAVEVDENKLIAERRGKLARIRESRNAFPNEFLREHYCRDLQETWREKTKEEIEAAAMQVSVAGRLMRNRGAFLVIQDMTGQIQLYVNRQNLAPELLEDIKTWDLGDIVGCRGILSKSNKGDLYVDMREVNHLVKSLRPLPDKFKGLSDMEMRYRQRYVDLIVMEEVRHTFRVRSMTVDYIREYHPDGSD